MDFYISPGEHPTVKKYKAADKTWKPRAGTLWWKVGKIKAFDGKERFPLLTKLIAGLLSIPVSNADSERGFSILRKIHTDQRPSLKQDTLIALMTMKFNAYNDCYDSSFSDELLTKCKKATVNAVKKPTDDADGDQEL